METLYSFFVHSTFRWDLLKEALRPDQRVLKRATGTRWSAKFDSVDAVNGSISEVQAVLLRIINDESLQQTNENKALALGVLRDLCKFENLLMLKIWHAVLVKFEKVNRMLQKSDLNFSVAAQLYRGLVSHTEEMKTQFDQFFDVAKSMYITLNAEENTLKTRSAITLANMEKSRQIWQSKIFDPIMESLLKNLHSRMDCYVKLDERFSFLAKLKELNSEEIKTACQGIASFYANDVEEKELISECGFAKQFFFSDLPPSKSISITSLYSTIIKDDLQAIFPNIEIILRIFLCLFVTNAPDERSFSKLKYIKDALRNRMTEEKLNAFALMSIENEILDFINTDEIIDEFVLLKCRKMSISDNF